MQLPAQQSQQKISMFHWCDHGMRQAGGESQPVLNYSGLELQPGSAWLRVQISTYSFLLCNNEWAITLTIHGITTHIVFTLLLCFCFCVFQISNFKFGRPKKQKTKNKKN